MTAAQPSKPKQPEQSKQASSESSVKMEAIKAALSQIKKKYGDGAIMEMGDTPNVQIEKVSSGSLGLDIALGVGGIPKGRVIEIFGPESSGKTTLASPYDRGGAAKRRPGGVHRRGACPGLQYARKIGRGRRLASSSRSPITASRPWRSARRSCVPAASRSSSSTPSPH